MDRKPPLGAIVAIAAIVILLAGLWWRPGVGQRSEGGATAWQGAPTLDPAMAGLAQVAGEEQDLDKPEDAQSRALAPTASDITWRADDFSDFSSKEVLPSTGPLPAVKEMTGSNEAGADIQMSEDRANRVAAMRRAAEENRRKAIERANELGIPIREETAEGGVIELYGIEEDGRLLFHTGDNAVAAVSTAANLVQAAPYSLNGTGILVGVWDTGGVFAAHQEMTGRVSAKDGASTTAHATHVAGTIIASGVTGAAKGMAPAARMDSYDWQNDFAELDGSGANAATQTNRVLVSNHSYSTVTGWRRITQTNLTPPRMWDWYGLEGASSSSFDKAFGQYSTDARSADETANMVPYTTIFWSAGNHLDENPKEGDSIALSRGNSNVVTYNAAIHPPGDGLYRGGFDTISYKNLAKNVVTIGAVEDAERGGVRAIDNAKMITLSAWGPTDDGRIKPDLVANGRSVYSCSNAVSTYYGMSGTSSAAPNAAGTAALIAQDYIRLFGRAMRSSTMKGLLIHTADDLGTAGPDYVYGWGLVNGKAAVDLVRDQAINAGRWRLSENLLTTSGNTVTRSFVWDGLSPIRVTICWTDPPGTVIAESDSRTPTLVNNLDLRLVAPNGFTYFPYVMPFVGTWTQASMSSAAIPGNNNTDNVEQVYVAAPPVKGTYQAVVSYQGTLSGNQQHFSMLISGSGELPGVATGVIASALGSTSIRVTWSAASSATSYKILRGGTQIATVSSGTSFTDSGLTPATDYTYRVVSSNSSGDAAPSSPSTARTSADNKTDGIPDTWWVQYNIPVSQRIALADWDRDGLSNLLEYFAGLNPTSVDAGAVFSPKADAGVAWMDYRRSKLAEGVRGQVRWTTDLNSRNWSGQNMTDVVLEGYSTYEIRRASVPWQRGDAPIFMRLGINWE